ncbi:MAG TPA: hypothetical protein DCY31_04940 [Ruminococcaceae bacterium]|nr:hypothetical protein [Oscillospiraceae bacterium]
MKRNKSSYFVGIAFICIIAAFFGSVIFRFYRAQVYFDYGGTTAQSEISAPSASSAAESVWVKEYPFDEDEKFSYDRKTEVVPQTVQTQSTVSKKTEYLTYVNWFKNSVDYYTTKLLPGRMRYVEANALFSKTVGMKIIAGTDSVVVMKNGYLTFESAPADTSEAVESVKWFSDEMKKRNIDFSYVQYPSKEDKNDEQLPDGVVDYSNKNADSLLAGLEKNGVNYLDMRPLLSQKDSDWYSDFFKTDHHWKPETGVWASGKIAEMLNGKFGYSLDTDIGNLENYNVDVYEKYCLGSQGKIATLTYADPEDISLVYPKKSTSFTVQYDNDAAKTGAFEDVMFNRNYLNKDYYNNSAYSTYINGNKTITRIKNNDCKNGKKILIIGGSYNKCVVPYLSQDFESTELLDRRYFDGSVLNYIDKTKPDVVLVAYTPTLISDASTHSSTFNFE